MTVRPPDNVQFGLAGLISGILPPFRLWANRTGGRILKQILRRVEFVYVYVVPGYRAQEEGERLAVERGFSEPLQFGLNLARNGET